MRYSGHSLSVPLYTVCSAASVQRQQSPAPPECAPILRRVLPAPFHGYNVDAAGCGSALKAPHGLSCLCLSSKRAYTLPALRRRCCAAKAWSAMVFALEFGRHTTRHGWPLLNWPPANTALPLCVRALVKTRSLFCRWAASSFLHACPLFFFFLFFGGNCDLNLPGQASPLRRVGVAWFLFPSLHHFGVEWEGREKKAFGVRLASSGEVETDHSVEQECTRT